jgi:hypothetical protein
MDYTLLSSIAGGCVVLLVFCGWRALRDRANSISDYRFKKWFDLR